MTFTCTPETPAIPTFYEAIKTPDKDRTPLERFVAQWDTFDDHVSSEWRAQLSAALEWYADNRIRLQMAQRLAELREEVRAGFDSSPGYEPEHDEGSGL